MKLPALSIMKELVQSEAKESNPIISDQTASLCSKGQFLRSEAACPEYNEGKQSVIASEAKQSRFSIK
jgi:hypothetical protein